MKNNLLKDKFPELLKEYDYQKNDLDINTIYAGSGKKVWWICPNNHSYLSTIKTRTALNVGCPYCSGRLPIKGKTDLQTLFPDLCKEGNANGWWDFEKNLKEFNLKPDEIAKYSSKKVWWKCLQGHSYLMRLASKTKDSHGCPYCAGQMLIKGENDLLSNFPDICKEWDYELNTIKPDEIMVYSNKKAYWKCKHGHSWMAIVYSRTTNKTGCPYCSNQKVFKGYNDLQTLYPELCNEWDYEKNDCNPDEVIPGSPKLVWWKCPNNHSYKRQLAQRTERKFGCAYCSGKQVLKGYNDLLSNFPDIAKEWNYKKNIIKPDEVTKRSHKKVWWECSKGHEWETTILSRTKNETGCPYCANQKVLKGYNDLQSKNPDIAKEWDYELNNIEPDQINYRSHEYAWWKCSQGHSWKAIIASRTQKNSGCPLCCKQGTSNAERYLFTKLNNFYICEQRKKHKINNKSWETDIFIPELNLGIEFNGLYWHKIKTDRTEKDKLKESALSSKMNLLYVLESTENKIIGNKIYFDCKHKYKENLIWAGEQLLAQIKFSNRGK